MCKAKVVLASEDGKDWFVYRVDYVTKAKSEYSKHYFTETPVIVEGTTLKKITEPEQRHTQKKLEEGSENGVV